MEGARIRSAKAITAAFLSKENGQSPFKNILLQLQDRFCVVDGGRSETIGFFIQQSTRPTFRKRKGLMRPIFILAGCLIEIAFFPSEWADMNGGGCVGGGVWRMGKQ
jgi:hypothetical protein